EKAGLTKKAARPSSEGRAGSSGIAAIKAGGALDNSNAISQTNNLPSGAVTADQAAIHLDVSGPQAAATADGRTEQISAPDTKRRRKDAEAAKPAPSAPPRSRKRLIVAAGAALSLLAAVGLVADATFAEAPPGGAPVATVGEEGTPSKE